MEHYKPVGNKCFIQHMVNLAIWGENYKLVSHLTYSKCKKIWLEGGTEYKKQSHEQLKDKKALI